MAIIGYVRISALDRGSNEQSERVRAENCDRIHYEDAVGRVWPKCLQGLLSGDVLVVTKLDRLARSVAELGARLQDIGGKGAFLRVLDGSLNTQTEEGQHFASALIPFIEFESNVRRERQLSGVEKAKAKGRYIGRKPTAQAKRGQIAALLAKGLTKAAIAEKLGISVASVYNVIKSGNPVKSPLEGTEEENYSIQLDKGSNRRKK